MIKLSCPSCGAEIKFLSKASVFAVCSFCKSTVVRHDMNLDLLGKMGELQAEMTPIQIGTQGYFNEQLFDVIGRLRVSYDQGFWNEWYTIFPDGREGWLAEAQGFFAMCFPIRSADMKLPDPMDVVAGDNVLIPGHGLFKIDDVRDVVCKYSEGELPMQAAKGRESRSVDLRGGSNRMATIEYASDCTRVYVGSYQEFDLFKFKHLREIDGW